jgi:hypothetical protein
MKSSMSYQLTKIRRNAQSLPWHAAVLGGWIEFWASLFILASATWIVAGLFKVTDGSIQQLNVRGTVWTGSGRVLLTGGSDSRDKAVLPGTFKCELRPAWAGLETPWNKIQAEAKLQLTTTNMVLKSLSGWMTLSDAFKLRGGGSWIGPRLRLHETASVNSDIAAIFANLLTTFGRRQGVQSIITFG